MTSHSEAFAMTPSTPDDARADQASPVPPVMIKKYANRRLYDTESSSYITLEDLAAMVRRGRDFAVSDAKTGEDITRSVLTQIIVEEESKVGRAMLPIPFLRQLIGLYGDSLQSVVPGFLEQSMAAFSRHQQQMRVAVQQTMDNFLPHSLEAVGRQNMAMMERAMTLFTPFLRPSEQAGDTASARDRAESQMSSSANAEDELSKLRAELQRARAQLDEKDLPQTEFATPTVEADAATPFAPRRARKGT